MAAKKFLIEYEDGTTEERVLNAEEIAELLAPDEGIPQEFGSTNPTAGAAAVRYGPGMIPGPAGVAGAGLGSLAADMIEGETEGSLGRAGAAAGGAALGGVLGKGLGALWRFRPSFMPNWDAKRIGEAVAKEAPELAPPGTGPADLFAALRGGPGKVGPQERLSGAYNQAVDAARQIPPATRQVGPNAYRWGMGQFRQPALPASTALATTLGGGPRQVGSRSLGPDVSNQAVDAASQVPEAAKQAYARGSQLKDWFSPTGPDPYKGGRFSQRALQEAMETSGERGAQRHVSPEFEKAVFRGGKMGGGRDVEITPSVFQVPIPLGTIKNRLNNPAIARLVQALLQAGGAGGGSQLLGP